MTDLFSGGTGNADDSNDLDDSDNSDELDDSDDGDNGVSETIGSWFLVSFLLLCGGFAQFLQI